MRTALLVVGLIWALIGVGNIIIGLYNINKMGSSEGWSVFTLIFNMVLFVLPGLGVAGLGKLIKKKLFLERGIRRSVLSVQRKSSLKLRFAGFADTSFLKPQKNQ